MHVGIFLKHASATKIDVNRDIDLSRCNISVKKPFATGGAAQTRNSVIAVPFSFEFIVVREFFICGSVNKIILPNNDYIRRTCLVQYPSKRI
jgi:hypothetical protein